MKNLKSLLLIVPLLTVLWSGCKKEELPKGTTVRGQALEIGTKKPLPNAKVWLTKSSCPSFTTGCNYDEVEGTRTTTDASGNFSITIPDVSGRYELRGSYPGYKLGGYSDVFTGEVNENAIVSFYPPAWLRINVKAVGTTPLVFGDEIYISAPGFASSVMAAGNLDISRITPVDGGVKYSVYYSLKRNGVVLKYNTDTVYCTGNDTTTYNLHY